MRIKKKKMNVFMNADKMANVSLVLVKCQGIVLNM